MTPPGVYALFVEYPKTGHVTVLTFHSPFLRAIEMIALASQPVVLTPRDY